MNIYEPLAERMLSAADVRLDGARPWDLRVRDPRFYRKAVVQGSIGFGESYMDGWWDTGDLEELFARIIRVGLDRDRQFAPVHLGYGLFTRLFNNQTKSRARRVAERHYDFGNDLFFEFLGRYKNYSCGYYDGTDDLDEAQRRKMDLLCRKLGLRAGDRVLDVGGGWGEIARYMADHYGARVTSINISEEQMRFSREHCRGASVEIVKCDYRDLKGTYDKIAVIAMLTHVGHKNYRAFMEKAHACLAPGGTMIIESVGGNRSFSHIDPWIDRYIFPGALIPSVAQFGRAFEGLFVVEDWHNFGPHYVKTLRAWNDRLQQAWPRLKDRYGGDRTRRMFEFFFRMASAAFRERDLQHWHIVLTRKGDAQPASCRTG